jgi:hypothetical protein
MMKRLVLTIGAAVAVFALAAPAFADEPPTNPYPGKKLDVLLYVDTVTSSRSAPKPVNVCSQTNFFPQGSRVVFRAWGIEAKTGKILSTDNIKYAYVKIAGQPNLKLSFGAHGTAPNQIWFWSAAWAIPADYPLGLVTYRVVVKTKSNKFGIFDPAGLAAGSRLTVTPKAP